MPLGEPTTWQQEMGGGGPRPRLDTLIRVMVLVVLAAALLAALPRSDSSSDTSSGGRVGPGCVEVARLEAHGIDGGRALAGARRVCARERKAADADTSGVHR